MRNIQAGFSMVELMLAIGIASVLSTVLVAFSLGYVADVFRSRAAAELAVESHFVLRTFVDDIRLADGIALTNTITDTNAPVDGWITSDEDNQIIINSPAITSSHDIIYDDSTGYPFRNQYIYFIQGNDLFRRTLKNTSAAGNTVTTTCPSANSSSSCPNDKIYTSNIQDFTLEFFDINNIATTDPTAARSVKLTIAMSRKTYGKTITLNNSVQTTLRNY